MGNRLTRFAWLLPLLSCFLAAEIQGADQVSIRADVTVAHEYQRQHAVFIISRLDKTNALAVTLDVGDFAWASSDSGYKLQLPDGTSVPFAGDGTVLVTIPAGSLEVALHVVPQDDAVVEGAQAVVLYIHSADQPAYEAVKPGSAQIEIADDDIVLFVDAVDPVAKERGDQWPATDSGQINLTWTTRGKNADGSPRYDLYSGPNLAVEIQIKSDSSASFGTDYFMVNRQGSWSGTVSAQSWNATDKTLTLSTNGLAESPFFDVGDYIWIEHDTDPRKITKVSGPTLTLDDSPFFFAVESIKDARVYSHLPDVTSFWTNLPAGEHTLEFRFIPKEDSTPEGGESISMAVTASSVYRIENPTVGQVIIADDDVSARIVKGNDASEPNLPGSFLVRLLNNSDKTWAATSDLTFAYEVSSGGLNATAGTDFTIIGLDTKSRIGTAIIPKGQSEVSLVILPLADAESEPIEYVSVTLKESTNFVPRSIDGSTNQATATIALFNSATTSVPALPIYFKPAPTPSTNLAGSSGGCGLGSGLGALVGLAATLAAVLRWRPRRR